MVCRCRRGELFDYLTEVVTLNETRTRFASFFLCILVEIHGSSNILVITGNFGQSLARVCPAL